VAVYIVPVSKLAVVFKEAVVLGASYVTVAASGVVDPCCTSVNVVVLRDEAFIASENIACTLLVTATPVAEAAGTVDDTVGATVSVHVT
jgi:hypothetical protein